MITYHDFETAARRLYDYCDYPSVRYKIETKLLSKPDHPQSLSTLHKGFLDSDVVQELYNTQDEYGGWGPLRDKDYSVKVKFPTSLVAINRCLYLGLTIDDLDILFLANDYLESFLLGTSREKFRLTNERIIPYNRALVCNAMESIQPNNPLCDETYQHWLYIASRTFEDGTYSYERESKAQHELFGTREARLVPMQLSLLTKRPDLLPNTLESALLHHYGDDVNEHGYFWNNCLKQIPYTFYNEYTNRWFYSIDFFNQFHHTTQYLEPMMEFLWNNQNDDGLWDWGSQRKDPWGYFKYMSTNRKYSFNRIVNCSMEILSVTKDYLDKNTS